LRILSKYGSAEARATLESHILTRKAQYGCKEEQTSPLAVANLCVALLDFSRTGSIECDIELLQCNNGDANDASARLPTPDPIQRRDSWQKVSFVEYVSSKIVAAEHVQSQDSVRITVRLFPLVSTGYVSRFSECYGDRQRCVATWPSQHSPQWLRSHCPRLRFSLDLLAKENCVRAADCANASTLLSYTVNSAAARIESPRCFVEYCVCLPRDSLTL
jgi:hypothetical protein